MDLIDILRGIGISGFADLVVMAAMIYTILILLKRTRAAFVLIGMFMIAALYLVSDVAGLKLTKAVLQILSAALLVGLIVIFQEEIKQFFERVANPRLVKSLVPWNRRNHRSAETEILVRTLHEMARRKIGALVVLKGQDAIARFLDGGVDLDGRISEPVLESIFDPHSMGHDGAVVIEDESIVRFGVHLPLSKNLEKLRYVGTRHAAALGLSEVSDALCLAVSEERGTITAARRGDLEIIEHPERLRTLLVEFWRETLPKEPPRMWRDLYRKNWKEKAFAIVATLVLWYVLVYKHREPEGANSRNVANPPDAEARALAGGECPR